MSHQTNRVLRVVLPGGSGQVGNILARHFHTKGDSVIVLTRRPFTAPWQTVAWDSVRLGSWVKELEQRGRPDQSNGT